MAWEKFHGIGESYRPKVSVRANGHLGFATGARKKFHVDSYKFVSLFFDRSERKIGIKLGEIEEPGVTTPIVKRETDCYIRARSFLDYYDIDYKQGCSYHAAWERDQNMIVVDLRRPIKSKGHLGQMSDKGKGGEDE